MLAFACPCGFRQGDVQVGATLDGEHQVVFCLTCRRIFSIWTNGDQSGGRHPRSQLVCRDCRAPLLPITAPGGLGPPALQAQHPGLEPWLVADRTGQGADPRGGNPGEPASIRIVTVISSELIRAIRAEYALSWQESILNRGLALETSPSSADERPFTLS